MAHDPCSSIVITDGYWMHIHSIRIYHRNYPETRGEGASLTDAAAHLSNQLARAIDSVHGHAKREGIGRALADVRAFRMTRPVRRDVVTSPGIPPTREKPQENYHVYEHRI